MMLPPNYAVPPRRPARPALRQSGRRGARRSGRRGRRSRRAGGSTQQRETDQLPGAGVHPRGSSNYCFIFNCRLIAAAASWAFLTESACLPASCSALASLARATAFLEASSVLPAVASVICLIRVGHWLANAGPATRPTIARAIIRFFIQFTSFRREGRNRSWGGSSKELEVISKLGIEGEGSIAWAHGMASPHRRAVGADTT